MRFYDSNPDYDLSEIFNKKIEDVTYCESNIIKDLTKKLENEKNDKVKKEIQYQINQQCEKASDNLLNYKAKEYSYSDNIPRPVFTGEYRNKHQAGGSKSTVMCTDMDRTEGRCIPLQYYRPDKLTKDLDMVPIKLGDVFFKKVTEDEGSEEVNNYLSALSKGVGTKYTVAGIINLLGEAANKALKSQGLAGIEWYKDEDEAKYFPNNFNVVNQNFKTSIVNPIRNLVQGGGYCTSGNCPPLGSNYIIPSGQTQDIIPTEGSEVLYNISNISGFRTGTILRNSHRPGYKTIKIDNKLVSIYKENIFKTENFIGKYENKLGYYEYSKENYTFTPFIEPPPIIKGYTFKFDDSDSLNDIYIKEQPTEALYYCGSTVFKLNYSKVLGFNFWNFEGKIGNDEYIYFYYTNLKSTTEKFIYSVDNKLTRNISGKWYKIEKSILNSIINTFIKPEIFKLNNKKQKIIINYNKLKDNDIKQVNFLIVLRINNITCSNDIIKAVNEIKCGPIKKKIKKEIGNNGNKLCNNDLGNLRHIIKSKWEISPMKPGTPARPECNPKSISPVIQQRILEIHNHKCRDMPDNAKKCRGSDCDTLGQICPGGVPGAGSDKTQGYICNEKLVDGEVKLSWIPGKLSDLKKNQRNIVSSSNDNQIQYVILSTYYVQKKDIDFMFKKNEKVKYISDTISGKFNKKVTVEKIIGFKYYVSGPSIINPTYRFFDNEIYKQNEHSVYKSIEKDKDTKDYKNLSKYTTGDKKGKYKGIIVKPVSIRSLKSVPKQKFIYVNNIPGNEGKAGYLNTKGDRNRTEDNQRIVRIGSLNVSNRKSELGQQSIDKIKTLAKELKITIKSSDTKKILIDKIVEKEREIEDNDMKDDTSIIKGLIPGLIEDIFQTISFPLYQLGVDPRTLLPDTIQKWTRNNLTIGDYNKLNPSMEIVFIQYCLEKEWLLNKIIYDDPNGYYKTLALLWLQNRRKLPKDSKKPDEILTYILTGTNKNIGVKDKYKKFVATCSKISGVSDYPISACARLYYYKLVTHSLYNKTVHVKNIVNDEFINFKKNKEDQLLHNYGINVNEKINNVNHVFNDTKLNKRLNRFIYPFNDNFSKKNGRYPQVEHLKQFKKDYLASFKIMGYTKEYIETFTDVNLNTSGLFSNENNTTSETFTPTNQITNKDKIIFLLCFLLIILILLYIK